MTAKDLPIVSLALRARRPMPTDKFYGARLMQWEGDVSAVAEALQATDLNFNLEAFIKACKG